MTNADDLAEQIADQRTDRAAPLEAIAGVTDKAAKRPTKGVVILRQPGPIADNELKAAREAREAAVTEAVGEDSDKSDAYKSLTSQGGGD